MDLYSDFIDLKSSKDSQSSLSGTGELQKSLSDLENNPMDSPAFDSELDGSDQDDIAICGLSIKFPQDATSPEAFWKMMVERRCAMTEFPADRLNADGFYNKKNKLNAVCLLAFVEILRSSRFVLTRIATSPGWSFSQGGLSSVRCGVLCNFAI